jgi:radical SAM protein (TIGR01212 family)
MDPFINTFSQYYKKKYGQQVGKIALDAGVVCPNRSRGGCIYCAPENFTPYYLEKGDTVAMQLQKGRTFLAHRGFKKYFAYFQQETTTALVASELLPQLAIPFSDPDCIGLIISTRPDYVQDELLTGLSGFRERYDREVLIEVGLQSARDVTLRFLNRNHTFADFEDVIGRLRSCQGIELGVHLILGLPGEGFPEMLATINAVRRLDIDYLKFHHLQVIRGTRLAEIFMAEPFTVYDQHRYLTLLAELLGHVPSRVVIHRLWSTADPRLLIAPQWGAPAPARLHNDLLAIMKEKSLCQGSYLEP